MYNRTKRATVSTTYPYVRRHDATPHFVVRCAFAGDLDARDHAVADAGRSNFAAPDHPTFSRDGEGRTRRCARGERTCVGGRLRQDQASVLQHRPDVDERTERHMMAIGLAIV